jgi:hypothetical protein
MPDRQLLTPARLEELLTKLDEVMDEAERLRREVTRQLDTQSRVVQQSVIPPRKRAAKRR